MEDVRRKALMRLEYEGLDKGRPDPAAYAMDRYAYYVCFKCKKVSFPVVSQVFNLIELILDESNTVLVFFSSYYLFLLILGLLWR